VGEPRLARDAYRAQAADLAERVALVHLGMAERVQGDGRVAGAARPAAQGHLLGHRARREERGGLGAEQSGDLRLQRLDDPVAVHVGQLVQVVEVLCPVQHRQAFPERLVEAEAREHPPCAAMGGQPPLTEPCARLLVRQPPGRLLVLFRRVTHAPDPAPRARAGIRISGRRRSAPPMCAVHERRTGMHTLWTTERLSNRSR
jgi:hypothetical protein